MEFAIILLPLIILLFGVVEFGRAYSLHQRMNYAAREAARAVALHWDDDPAPDLLALAEDTVAATFNDPPTVVGPVTCDLDADTTIVLQDSISLVIPGFDQTLDLEATAQMSCES